MKNFLSILLTVLATPFLIVGLLLMTVKFQLLNSNFWLTSLERNNVYDRVALVIKTSAESQVAKEGGSVQDAKILTNLITPDNTKDIISKNLISVLNFTNGKTTNLDVYIPISKLPKHLLPASIADKPDVIPIETILSEYNIRGVSKNQIWILGMIGTWVTRILIVDWVIVAIFLASLFFLTQSGKKFWNIGATLILSGIIVVAGYVFLEIVRGSMINDWPKGNEPSQHILGTFLPFVLGDFLKLWIIAGIFLVVCGIALFFVRRRVYNGSK